MAVIVKKEGKVFIYKSLSFPMTENDKKRALIFDQILKKRIPEIEKELIHEKLLNYYQPENSKPKGETNLWFSLGLKLKKLLKDNNLINSNEYQWALQAIEMYASKKILRKNRGSSRNHFDYCIRISQFPWRYVKKLNWSDWGAFFDLKSLRQEKRIDRWITKKIEKICKLGRPTFRKFAKELNKEFNDIDTSIYSDEELFSIYNRKLEKYINLMKKNE